MQAWGDSFIALTTSENLSKHSIAELFLYINHTIYLFHIFLQLEEPLGEILVFGRLSPLVFIDINGFFLGSLFPFIGWLSWWFLLTSLFSLCLFRLLFFDWAFQFHFILSNLFELRIPNSKISNFTKIFLDPVKILAHHLLAVVAIITNDDISFFTFFHISET